jgi:hypothetical protein
MRWRSVSLTACSAAVLAAGCGGSGDRLPVLTGLRLATLAGDVAAGHGCGGPLVAAAVAAVNAGEVPPALQEQLLGDANAVRANCSRTRAQALADRLRP